jgi:hypothetical protein
MLVPAYPRSQNKYRADSISRSRVRDEVAMKKR